MTVKELIDELNQLPDDLVVMTPESSSFSNLHPATLVKRMLAIPYDAHLYFATDDPTGVEDKVETVVVVW